MIVFFIIICLVIISVMIDIRSDSDDVVSGFVLIIGFFIMLLLFIPRYEYTENTYKKYYASASKANIELNTAYSHKVNPDSINIDAVIDCYNDINKYNDALLWNVRWYKNPWLGIFFCSKKWASHDFIEPMFESPSAYVDAIRTQYNNRE